MPDRRPEDAAPTPPVTPAEDTPDSADQPADRSAKGGPAKRTPPRKPGRQSKGGATPSGAARQDQPSQPRRQAKADQPNQPNQPDKPNQPARPDKPVQSNEAPDERELSERINTAYAASDPVVADADHERDQERKQEREQPPSGAQRFAAALAATKGGPPKGGPEEGGPDKGGAPPGGTADADAAAGAKAAEKRATKKAPGKPKAAATRRVRRARLRLTHIDPWSVMKTSFLLSVAIGIVTVVAVAVVWGLLGAAGLWDSIDSAVGDVLGESSEGFTVEDYVGTSRVMGFTMIVAVVDVVLITVIATLAAFLYNLAATLLGGIEVVLAEEDR